MTCRSEGCGAGAARRRQRCDQEASGWFKALGIPTVSDRIVQGVVKACLEPELERHFHPDSYGYRPDKSALEAVGVARQRCWRYDWVLDLDIRAFLDRASYRHPPYEG
jgi:RNA-directed DNA polymerase